MSNFKITWRIAPAIYSNTEKWQSFLRLIDKYDDVADEVAFYIVDDTFPELSPLEDKKRQAEVCETCFDDLRKRGCTVGINVWPTIPLYDIEKAYFPDMRRMVGIDGVVSDNLVCPVSDEFIEYMSEKYAVFAKINPDFIWMDDDLRFTHMGSNYPCFCEECVKNFKNGAFSSREELEEALAKDKNRDLRIAWSSYGAERLAKLCSALRAKVDQINPNIDIALMTVGATHTTFSGDYIEKCMKELCSRRARPGHDLYSDRNPDKIMWKILEVGRQVLEYPETTTDIYWEEDSHPQGHLGKSFHTRQNEVSLGLMAGCTGVAFNHLSLNGNLDKRLAREIDELHSLRSRWEKFYDFSKDLSWVGMWPMYSWFMTAKADPKYAWLMENPFGENDFNYCDITPPEKIGPFGIALTADRNNASATLLSGKTLTALDKDELKAVFSSNVYMDVSALQALEELGLEKWAGVRANPIKRSAKPPCVFTNHPFNGDFAGHSYRTADATVGAQTLEPLDENVEWLGYRPKYMSDGELCYISKYQNELGGKVIVNGYDAWIGLDSPNNLYQLASIAEWFDLPLRLEWKNENIVSRVQPYIRTNGKKAAVMLLNASFDTTNPFEIIVKGEMTNAVLLKPDGSETKLLSRRENDSLCVDIPTIDMWDIAFVILK